MAIKIKGQQLKSNGSNWESMAPRKWGLQAASFHYSVATGFLKQITKHFDVKDH